MRANYKYLMIFLSAALIWVQSATAMHDQIHHHIADDCVMCQVVENGNDKAPDVNVIETPYSKADFKVQIFSEKVSHVNVWVNSYSRAPPVS